MLTTDPCILVIFGASGDLTSRKLVPAMYEMHVAGQLHASTVILGVSRTQKSDDAWRDELKQWVSQQVKNFDAAKYAEFAKRLFYFAGDAVKSECYPPLEARLAELAAASVEPMQWDAPFQGAGYECAACPKHPPGKGPLEPWEAWVA